MLGGGMMREDHWRWSWSTQNGPNLNNCPSRTKCVIVMGYVCHQFYNLPVIFIHHVAHRVQHKFCQIVNVGALRRVMPRKMFSDSHPKISGCTTTACKMIVGSLHVKPNNDRWDQTPRKKDRINLVCQHSLLQNTLETFHFGF